MTPINLAGIPDELKRVRQWVLWKRETRNGKPTKVCYQPTGQHAKSNDPATWADFQTCLDALSRFDGLGVMFADGLMGIDLDHHVDERGNLSDFAREVVSTLPTYWEFSPSGRGLHALCYGTLPAGGRKSAQHGLEMYCEGRYFTVTGNHLEGTPSTVKRLNGEIAQVHARVFGVKPAEPPTATTTPTKLVNLDDQQVIERAMLADNGGKFLDLWTGSTTRHNGDHSSADLALCEILAFWAGRDAGRIDSLFRQSGLMRPKWDERHYADGRTYGQATIERAIANTHEVYTPHNGLVTDNTPPMPDAPNNWSVAESTPDVIPSKRKRDRHTPTDDELAARWLNAHPMTAYGLGDWRRYSAGAWPVVPEDEIKRELMDILIAAKREGVRPSRYVLSSVAEMARLAVSISSEQWDAKHDILVCRNGALKISTRELLPHDPKYYATEKLPYDFDPNADAPTWRYVLESTIPEAADFVQDFAGYCLTPDCSLETALWFHGVPGGGRSTIIGGFEAMLGNRAGLLGLAAIERSQFALTNLPGKTLVTSTEQPSLYIRSAHVLNAIISGESLTVERKYEHPYQITPRAKILWAMNDLPRISEANSGLFRRVKIVRFSPRDEARRDPAIKDRVRREAAGILNWALTGLDRLRQRGRFEVPKCVQDATADFRESNDIPAVFVSEMCLIGPDYRTQGGTLYDAYKRWCADTGHKPQSSTSLAEDWRRLGFDRYRSMGKTFWRGIGLLDQTTPE